VYFAVWFVEIWRALKLPGRKIAIVLDDLIFDCFPAFYWWVALMRIDRKLLGHSDRYPHQASFEVRRDWIEGILARSTVKNFWEKL
jgi:hypothetical protein